MKRVIAFLIIVAIVFSMTGCIIDVDESTREKKPNIECKVIQFDVDYEYYKYNAIVCIENKGDTAIDLGYSIFDVEDSKGHLVATESSSAIYAQPQIVYPGECGYYFAARLELPDNISKNEQYSLSYRTDYISVVDVEPKNDFQTMEVSFPDGDYSKVIGRISNGSRVGTADVICICYSASHQIVTIGGTMVELSSTGKTTFEIWNMAAYDKTGIVEYEIIARAK